MKKCIHFIILIAVYVGLKMVFDCIPVKAGSLLLLYVKKAALASSIISAALFYIYKDKISFKSLHIATPHWARYVLIGLGTYLLVIPVLMVTTMAGRYLLSLFSSGAGGVTRVPSFTSPTRSMLYALYAITVTPFVQELFFRGAVYTSLRGKIGVWPALLVSALLFSLLHFKLIWILPYFFLGIFFGYLYEKTGSLLTPIAAHAMNNVVALFFYFLF